MKTLFLVGGGWHEKNVVSLWLTRQHGWEVVWAPKPSDVAPLFGRYRDSICSIAVNTELCGNLSKLAETVASIANPGINCPVVACSEHLQHRIDLMSAGCNTQVVPGVSDMYIGPFVLALDLAIEKLLHYGGGGRTEKVRCLNKYDADKIVGAIVESVEAWLKEEMSDRSGHFIQAASVAIAEYLRSRVSYPRPNLRARIFSILGLRRCS